eukprot:314308-Rhodomonas_salina.1
MHPASHLQPRKRTGASLTLPATFPPSVSAQTYNHPINTAVSLSVLSPSLSKLPSLLSPSLPATLSLPRAISLFLVNFRYCSHEFTVALTVALMAA